MDKKTFLEQLGEKLLAHGISKEDVDNQLSRFEKYFSTMGEAEANSQIDSLEDMDALAENICELLNSPPETDNRETEESDSASEAAEAADEAEPDASTPDDEDSDVKIADNIKEYTESAPEPIDDEILNADTVNFDRVEFAGDKISTEDHEKALLIAETISFDAVKSEGSGDAPQGAEVFVDLDAYSNASEPFEDEDIYSIENPEADAASDTIRFERVESEQEDNAKIKKLEKKTARFLKKIERQKKKEATSDNEGDAEAFDVSDGSPTSVIETAKPVESAPKMKDNALLFWMLAVVTLPITISAAILLFSLVAAGFVAIAGLIAASFVMVGVIAVAGSTLALFGIIFGIIQLFSVVPAGIYEIGIGVIIAGITILSAVLLYNVAIRFLPRVMKRYSAFAKSILKKAWNHLVALKKECVG